MAEKGETMRDSPSSRLPIWMLILTIPLFSAGVITYLFHNVLSSLATFIGSLFAILITSFITGFGQQFQNVLAPDIFARIRNFIRGRAYERRYRPRMIRECDVLDTTGLPAKPGRKFQLTNVFVEPYLVNKPIQRTSTDLLKPPDLTQSEPQTIWDYLEKTKEHLVILGVPGSGKTTLLRHVASEFSQNRNRRKLAISNPQPLPFLLLLRNYGEVIKDSSPYSLVKAIEMELSRWEEPPQGWVEHQLTRKGGLVLLDGLDEVADEESRRRVVKWVHDQMTAYYQSQFVLTSRPYGYKGNELLDSVVLEVQSFTPEQISECIDRWYLEWLTAWEERQDDEVRAKARKKAEDLRRRMRRKHALWKLAINPFLLHMIAIVHDYGNTLPEKRVELYKEICRIFLGTRDEARNIIHPLSPSQQQWVLETLAYKLMLEKELKVTRKRAEELIAASLAEVNPRLPPGKFLDLVETRSGLLREKELGVYGFAHKVFQEYLAAVYIGSKYGNVQELVNRVGDDWWHETILLYCAQNDTTPLIEACLAGDTPPISMIRLALECRNEAQRMELGTRTRLDKLISQEGAADQDPISRQQLAEALLGNRLSDNQLIPLSEAEDTFVSPSLINCVEYQLFLDEQQGEDTGKGGAPDHWKDSHFLPGHGHYSVLGIRSSDATEFCVWLTERERGLWRYRLPKSSEIQEIRAQLVDVDQPPQGCGFWLDSGGSLAWVKQEGPRLPEPLFRKRLAQDYEQLVNASQVEERADIAVCLNAVQGLIYLQTVHYDLAYTLLDIRRGLSEQAKEMQSKYFQTEERVSRLRAKLKRTQDELSSLQATQLSNSINSQHDKLRTEDHALRSFRRDIRDLTAKIVKIDNELGIIKREKSEYQASYEHENRRWFFKDKQHMNSLQANIAKLSTQITTLEAQRAQHLRDQVKLKEQEKRAEAFPTYVSTSRSTNQGKIESSRADLERLRKQEADISTNLKQEQEQLEVHREQFSHLTAHLSVLSSICDNTLAFALTYDEIQPLMRALAGRPALNFDIVLPSSDSQIKTAQASSQAIFASIYRLASTHLQELANAVTELTNLVPSKIDNRELTKLLNLSHELTRVFAHVNFQRNLELLVDVLHSSLAELITHRPLGSSIPLLRSATRYSAWGLALYLSYWSGIKPALPPIQVDPLKVRDTFLGIAVALALLEERIESNREPCEGIVIVREHRQQAL